MATATRRAVVMGAAAVLASGWRAGRAVAQSYDQEQLYGTVSGEPFPVAAVNLNRIRSQFLRSEVAYETDQPAGTIIIDPAGHHLYLTDGRGGAIRYGVGVGRQGFSWAGSATIHDKRIWPDWYPPKEMLARDPSIMESMSQLQGGTGMHGGPGNPLGARAMYLFQGNKDTLYRIHGTLEPWTIGSSVSSGCIRMINQDVIDLYERVPVGTQVVVLGSGSEQPEARRRRAPQADDADQYVNEPAPNGQYGAQQTDGYDQNAYGADPSDDTFSPKRYRAQGRVRQQLPPDPDQ